MTVLEVLIHLFGIWILMAALRLLSYVVLPPEDLTQMLTYHANTGIYCEHLLVSLSLLAGFSLLLCKCVKEKR